MLSSELEYCLNEAYQKASDARHEYKTEEHLLLSLLDNPTAARVLRACGLDSDRLRREIGAFIDEHSPVAGGCPP